MIPWLTRYMIEWLIFALLTFVLSVVVAVVLITAANSASGHRMECHKNARQQLVCRQCWTDARGQVRCGQPRIERIQ
jgi:hypothetical protein